MSLEQLKRDFKEKKIRKVYLFYGQEDYLIRHYSAELEKAVFVSGGQGGSGMDIGNLNHFDGEKNLERIHDACIAYPFFAEKRMVVIRNSGAFGVEKEQKSDKKSAAETEESVDSGTVSVVDKKLDSEGHRSLSVAAAGKQPGTGKKAGRAKGKAAASKLTMEQIVEVIPDTTCVLIIEDKVDKRRKLFGTISKQGLVVEFPYQKAEDIERWVANILTKGQKRISRNALKMFMERNGESLTEIKNELDKLMLYSGESADITEEDVRKVCTVTVKTKIFDLMDSVTAGDKRKALSELDSLILMKEPVQKIMIMLSKHLVQMAQMKNLSDYGKGLNEITTLMKLNPYHAKILFRQCKNYQREQLDAAVQKCYEKDLSVKSGLMEGTLALESLIATL